MSCELCRESGRSSSVIGAAARLRRLRNEHCGDATTVQPAGWATYCDCSVVQHRLPLSHHVTYFDCAFRPPAPGFLRVPRGKRSRSAKNCVACWCHFFNTMDLAANLLFLKLSGWLKINGRYFTINRQQEVSASMPTSISTYSRCTPSAATASPAPSGRRRAGVTSIEGRSCSDEALPPFLVLDVAYVKRKFEDGWLRLAAVRLLDKVFLRTFVHEGCELSAYGRKEAAANTFCCTYGG